MKWILKKILGSKNDRDVKKMHPMVQKINAFDESLKTLSDEELLDRFNIKYSETIKNSYPQSNLVEIEEETKGFLKLTFDYRDGVLPRSVVSFYHSTDGNNWNKIGSQHTSGLLINLIENDSYFEVGGWGDGQSPGGSYLDGFVKEVQINVNNENLKYLGIDFINE